MRLNQFEQRSAFQGSGSHISFSLEYANIFKQINALESLSSSTLTSEKTCLLRAGFIAESEEICSAQKTTFQCFPAPCLPLLWARSNVMGPSTHNPWKYRMIRIEGMMKRVRHQFQKYKTESEREELVNTETNIDANIDVHLPHLSLNSFTTSRIFLPCTIAKHVRSSELRTEWRR